MGITTGGGINFDLAQQSRDNRSRNIQTVQQAAQLAIGAEQRNREQSLQTGAQKFAQLMALAGPDPAAAQNYLASEAGTIALQDIQKDMSRAAGKNLSPEEAMQGAYVAASKYYADNPSIQSKMQELWNHTIPQRGGAEPAPVVKSTPMTPRSGKPGTPPAEGGSRSPEDVPYEVDPQGSRDVPDGDYEFGSFVNETNDMLANTGTMQDSYTRRRNLEREALQERLGFNTEEARDPVIWSIANDSPSLTFSEVREIAKKNYPEMYTMDGQYKTAAMRKSEADSETYDQMDARGKAFRYQADLEARQGSASPKGSVGSVKTNTPQQSRLAPTGEPTSDRRGPSDMGQSLAGIPNRNPLMPGVQSLGADLNSESLPASRGQPLNPAQVGGRITRSLIPQAQPQPVPSASVGTPLPAGAMAQAADQQTAALKEVVANMEPAKAARGEISVSPDMVNLGKSIVGLTQTVQEKFSELNKGPIRGAMDLRLGGLYEGIKDFVISAGERIQSGLPLSREERQKLAIANRGFESFSEKLDRMPMAEVRALQKEYLKWAESASFTELGAAGLDKMADREVQAYVVSAQANAAMARTLASAGSEEAKALVELQKVAMEGWGKAEEAINRTMVAEKKTRAKVLQDYPEYLKAVNAFAPMVAMKQISTDILRKRNLFELFTKQKGQGSGEAYGTYITDKSQESKPMTDAEKAAALNKYNGGK